jgi:ketosteroid isomerase-like protein
MKQILMITILSLMSLTSCQKLSTENDKKALEQLNKIWNDNILSGNRMANADLFTQDGIRIEGGKIYSGRDEIRALFSKQTTQRKYVKQENKLQRIWSSKEFITTEIIQSQSYIKNETGDTITLRNAAIAIYKRQPDGSLKLAYNLKAELSD